MGMAMGWMEERLLDGASNATGAGAPFPWRDQVYKARDGCGRAASGCATG
jgi:hypothetical protein